MADTDIVTSRAASRGRRRGGAGPTIADVAREAGVSPMTVSRVINQRDTVQPQAREAVRKAIALLGYVPNSAARKLATGSYCRIVLLYDNPSASFLSEMMVGSLDAAEELDVQIMPMQSAEGTARLLAKLSARNVEGVILPPPLGDDGKLIDALVGAGMTVSQLATAAPDPRACAVSIDDRRAARTMTERLAALGHRRMGFIAGAPSISASALRQAGYEEALEEAGIAHRTELIANGAFTHRSGHDAAMDLLALRDRPTAIFASSDDMAAGVLAAAQRRGIDVPGELSVCGFDDTGVAASIWPALTTIRQPVARMAGEAVRLVAGAVRNRGDEARAEHRLIDFELVVRDSDGPPLTNGRT